MSYVPKVYRKRGGAEQVVASGGVVTVESGGTVLVKSGAALNIATGGALQNNGTPMNLAAGIATSTSAITAELNVLAGVTPGTVIASKAYVADANIDVTGGRNLTVTGTLTGATVAATAAITATKTETSATPALARLIRSELTLTPETSLAVGSSASLAAIRGCVTLSSGKECTDGFLYGVQGKFVGDGATLSVGSCHVAGVYAQMSGSGMTVTDGHVAVIVASGQNLPTSANVNMIYAESGGGKVNAVIQSNVKADYFLDIADFESAGICSSGGTCTTPGQAHGWIKVKVGGAVRYIALSEAVS